MAEEFADELAAKAAQSARRAAGIALLCVMVAVLVLLVDNSIKKHIVAKANEARRILADFADLAERAQGHGAAAAQPVGDSGEHGADSADGVVGTAARGPEVAAAEVPEPDPAGGVRAGGASGPRGNG